MCVKTILLSSCLLVGASPFGTSYSNCCFAESTSIEKTNQKFYALLGSLRERPGKERYDKLQSFIVYNPGYNRAYLHLADIYIQENEFVQAKSYFDSLSVVSEHAQSANWALGRIYKADRKVEMAIRAYGSAMNFKPVHVALIKEFIEYSGSNKNGSRERNIFRKFSREPAGHLIVEALIAYNELQDDIAKNLLIKACKLDKHYQDDLTINFVLGHCFLSLGESSPADSVWNFGLEFAETIGDAVAQIDFLQALGYLKEEIGEKEAEEQYYRRALDISTHIDSKDHKQLLMGRLAFTRRRESDYPEARRLFLAAIGEAIKLDRKADLADWYRGYAMTEYHLGNYTLAIRFIGKAEEALSGTNYVWRQIWTKIDKVSILKALNQVDLADRLLDEAAQMAAENNFDYEQKLAEAKRGELLNLRGAHDKALAKFTDFIRYIEDQTGYEKTRFHWYGRLGRTYLLLGKYEQARSIYYKALRLAQMQQAGIFEAYFMLRLGDLAVTEDSLSLALERYDSARVMAETMQQDEILWEIFFGIGNLTKKNGDYQKAIVNYQRAAMHLEKPRSKVLSEKMRIGYFANGAKVYQNLAECFFNLYLSGPQVVFLDSAVHFLEMSKARVLKEVRRGGEKAELTQKYILVKQRLQQAQHKVREMAANAANESQNSLLKAAIAELDEARYSLIAEHLSQFNDTLTTDLSSIDIPNLEDLQQHLIEENLGLLMYHISDATSFVIAVSGRNVEAIKLELSTQELKTQVDSLLHPLHDVTNGNQDNVIFRAEIAHKLYRLLFAPVENGLNLSDKLLIVPDIEIYNLPFEMLLDRLPDRTTYLISDYPDYADDFLANGYDFSYAPSSSFIIPQKRSSLNSDRILVFADPLTKATLSIRDSNTIRSKFGWRFQPLRYATRESKTISKLHRKTTNYTRGDATEEKLFSEQLTCRVLHFATHAFVDSVFDDLSGLLLTVASDSQYDGILNGFEIRALNIDCDLVVLSACETGRGKVIIGEGAMALPRQFFTAGARSVIMTHWKVDDKFASDFMAQFYNEYLKSERSKIAAIAATKRNILQNINSKTNRHYQHPFFWASFVLNGEPVTQRTRPILIYVVILIIILFLIIVISIRNKISNRNVKLTR